MHNAIMTSLSLSCYPSLYRSLGKEVKVHENEQSCHWCGRPAALDRLTFCWSLLDDEKRQNTNARRFALLSLYIKLPLIITMANKALKLRLKAEASELAHPTCQYQTKAAHQETHAYDAAAMPSQDNLLPVPPSKAILAGFPPTCPVLYTDTNITPNISIKGIVETVFVDLSPGCKREYFYQVACVEQGKSFIARESQLQWALRSPVWVRLQYENPDSAMKRACTIVGCYKQDMYTTLYSVQEVNAGTCLFHGVTMDCIQYRPENDTTGQHVEPSATAAASAPNVANVGSVITSTQAVLTPVMPVSSTPAVKKHDERAVSRVTSSPRKRPITEAHHELQGCSAEFALPQWMEALCLVRTYTQK
jgi:hypothetical protein